MFTGTLARADRTPRVPIAASRTKTGSLSASNFHPPSVVPPTTSIAHADGMGGRRRSSGARFGVAPPIGKTRVLPSGICRPRDDTSSSALNPEPSLTLKFGGDKKAGLTAASSPSPIRRRDVTGTIKAKGVAT